MAMTTIEAARWREDFHELQGVLAAATMERPNRATSGELGWVVFERVAMLDAVNRIRARYGRAPVAREDIERAENRALGHVDYAAKFAMGAADLVHAAD